MEVFTNLLGPIAPLITYFPTEEKHSIDNKKEVDKNYLNNLGTDEINAIIKKYISFDDIGDPNKRLFQSFLILLSIPCVTMFFILITQHIGICMKVFVGFLTILHVIIITYYLRETSNNYKSHDIQTKLFNNPNIPSILDNNVKAIQNY